MNISRRWFMIGSASAIAAAALPLEAVAAGLQQPIPIIADPIQRGLRFYERVLVLPNHHNGVLIADVFIRGHQFLRIPSAGGGGGVGGWSAIGWENRIMSTPEEVLTLGIFNREGLGGSAEIVLDFEEQGVNFFSDVRKYVDGVMVEKHVYPRYPTTEAYLHRHDNPPVPDEMNFEDDDDV